MRLRADDRGVTVQIGTVLLFAVLVVLVSTYQATVVPQQNERVEFNHNQQVHGELQDLRDELRRTAATGSGGTASISLGARYPERAFFVNPAPPSGALETTPEADVTVENATATGETADYWNGDPRNFSTRGLTYEPRYSVYRDAPTTVYRNGVLYNRFADANVTLAGQRLVRGSRISLVALNGSLSTASNGAESVDVQPVSAAARTVTVRNETANVSVVVPTTLPEEKAVGQWRGLLAEEMNESRNDDRHVLAVEPGPNETADDVRIVLEPGTYDLQTAMVGVGSDVSGTEAHYVTDVRGDDASVSAGGKQRVVVEVRDRYNNPVSGVRVNGSVSAGSLGTDNGTTGPDGRAAFVYEAPEEGDSEETVAFDISEDPEAREEATVELYVDGGGDRGATRTYEVEWTDAVAENGDALNCEPAAEPDACTLDTSAGTTAELTAGVTEDGTPLTGATVDFALDDASSDWDLTDSGTTDDGSVGATLDVPERNATVTAYAASGDDVDPIEIRVRNPGAPDGPDNVPEVSFRVDDLSHVDQDQVNYVSSYDVSNTNGSFKRVSVQYANLEQPSGSGTNNSTAERGNLRYGLEYGANDEWNITVRVIYESDTGEEYVAARKSITDTADALNPAENDNLADPDSPTVDSYAVEDRSNPGRGPWYRIEYAVTPNGSFTGVRAVAIGLESGSGADSAATEAPSDTVDLIPGYGLGDELRVKLLVFDGDGAVVAVRAETDTANA